MWRPWSGHRSVASTEPFRETASMTAEYAQSDQFRGARIHLCDLAGLEIRDCEVSGLKVVDCYGSTSISAATSSVSSSTTST